MDFLNNSTENGTLSSSSTTESSISTSDGNTEFHWNPGSSYIILLLFALAQISIWSLFLFCYFARGKRNCSHRRPPSIAIIDLPPAYDVAVKKSVSVCIAIPMDPDPPTYTEVIASGSHLTV